MTTQTKPSAGAIRAAKAFNSIPRGWNKSNPAEELAEIIDRESGLAELLEAAKLALADESTASKVAEACRRAIARASNPNAETVQAFPKGRWAEKGTV